MRGQGESEQRAFIPQLRPRLHQHHVHAQADGATHKAPASRDVPGQQQRLQQHPRDPRDRRRSGGDNFRVSGTFAGQIVAGVVDGKRQVERQKPQAGEERPQQVQHLAQHFLLRLIELL